MKIETLADFMEFYNFSARKLARKIGVSSQAVLNWMNGDAMPYKKRHEQLDELFKMYNPELSVKKLIKIKKR